MRRMLSIMGSAVFLGLAMAAFVHANDTTAEIQTGGLVFSHSETIEMVKEDLSISMDKIEFSYVFHNSGDKDVDTIVAFPMPDIAGAITVYENYVDSDKENFLGFAVEQDGKPVDFATRQKASLGGVDVTDQLKKLKIPLQPLSAETSAVLDALPDDVKADLEAKQLVYADEIVGDNGLLRPLYPLWTLSQTYFWNTTFPAGKDVKVHHTYKPSIGSMVGMGVLDENIGPTGATYASYVQKYCVDNRIVKIAMSNNDNMDNNLPFYSERWISYILTTGGNWSGGAIGDFHLTVDTGNEDTILSMCRKGLAKTGPTRFEFSAKNFQPKHDLHILLLVKEDP